MDLGPAALSVVQCYHETFNLERLVNVDSVEARAGNT